MALTYAQRLALVLLFAQAATCLDVSLSQAAPSTAPSIPPSFLSFSIEQDRWNDYAGTTSRNDFFFNTLDNLGKLTGVPPQLRIGADSEDHTNFNPSVQFSQEIFPGFSATTPYPEASSITVGDGYFEAAQFLPPNTHVIWGLNLGQNNLTNAFLEAKSLAKAFSSAAIKNAGIVLDAIEIGNEADIYQFNGLRPSTYSSANYVSDWTKFATNITAAFKASFGTAPKYWGGAFGGSSHTTTGFSPQAIFSEGILSSAPGAAITTISQHRYSGSFCSGSGGLLQDLMTKSTIRSNLTQFSPDITATHAKGLSYVLGETNSYSCHGAPGVSNTAGAAIWALDYTLFASQLGIARVYFHQGIGYKYSLVQPVTLTRSILDGSTLATPLLPHVQPQYYGAIVAAEAIGSSGKTKIIELSFNDTRVSGYALYEGSTLARALIINSQAFLTTTTTPRGTKHINLKLSGSGAPTSMTVKRLSIPHADATSGLLWGGQTYENSTGRVSGTLVTTKTAVSAGVDIQDTEVVMLSFT